MYIIWKIGKCEIIIKKISDNYFMLSSCYLKTNSHIIIMSNKLKQNVSYWNKFITIIKNYKNHKLNSIMILFYK